MKHLFYLCLFSIIIGPLAGLPLWFPGVNLYFTDIFVLLIYLLWIGRVREFVCIIKKDKISPYFFIFYSILFLSFIFSPLSLNIQERVISGLYLLRYFAYFVIYITVLFLIKSKELSQKRVFLILSLVGVVLALVGWLQYFFYQDLRNLFYLGWDPHYKRIFATYFDPNYLGLILVLSLTPLFFLQANFIIWLARVFVFIALMFTYSRSSFLALVSASLFYSVIRRKYLFLGIVLVVLLFSILVLPRPGGEGVKLERIFSLEQRIENWKSGFELFAKYPVLGAGFNTVRYAKIQSGLSPPENLLTSHSGAGFENSFIFVAATSGAIGLFFYILLLVKIYQNVDLIGRMSLVATVVHSLFLNSLFFPWVMLWLWVIIASNGGVKGK